MAAKPTISPDMIVAKLSADPTFADTPMLSSLHEAVGKYKVSLHCPRTPSRALTHFGIKTTRPAG